jgi:hypothetical protein
MLPPAGLRHHPEERLVSVIVGISSRTDFHLTNAGCRVLMEIDCARTGDPDDRRTLESPVWSHFLDLTRLDREQSRRIAWLLDEAIGVHLERRLDGEERDEESWRDWVAQPRRRSAWRCGRSCARRTVRRRSGRPSRNPSRIRPRPAPRLTGRV